MELLVILLLIKLVARNDILKYFHKKLRLPITPIVGIRYTVNVSYNAMCRQPSVNLIILSLLSQGWHLINLI